MKARFDLGHVERGLKDFQRDTVDYAFRRLYLDEDSTSRFLVADEVGLGKTLVARGLIARAIEHLQDRVERIDIVYVCSNGDIARQNIARLNVTGQDDFAFPPRITLLPTRLHELNAPDRAGRVKVNFVSFTPGTSFDMGMRGGMWSERVLLHDLLRRAWGRSALRGAGAINVLRVTASFDWFQCGIRHFDPASVDAALAEGFTAALREYDARAVEQHTETLQERFEDLRVRMTRSREKRREADRRDQLKLLGELRRLLARSCVDALEPDLVILDEFQRFKHLLDPEREAGELAHHLFSHEDAKVVLLSATPYKMYTVAEDVTDDHYADFLDTLRFLFGSDDDQVAEFKRELRGYRDAMIDGSAEHISVLRRRRGRVERRLRKVIVRTERLAATPDRNGMLVERIPSIQLESDDVRSFVELDRLTRLLDSGDVLEYWKSTPFLLNFMEDYELGRAVEQATDAGRAQELETICRGARRVDWEAHENYRPLGTRNPRMRALHHEVIDNGAWRLLWIPPSLPYHRLGGPFGDERLAGFTKRLVFSAWAAVPRAVAALTSYEAERHIVRSQGGRPPRNTPEGREKMKPLLRFARGQGRLVGMPVLALVLPSPVLARVADPLDIATEIGPDASLTQVRRLARDRARAVLAPLVEGREGSSDPRWYWAAPLLLGGDETGAWLEARGARSWVGQGEVAESSTLRAHIEEALKVIRDESAAGRSDLGTPPADLADVVGMMSLASPGSCALRALSRGGRSTSERDSDSFDRRDAAARVAWGLRSYFNTPEAMRLIRAKHTPYWQRVLEYSLDGCLQAVLDEYVHVLPEWIGAADLEDSELTRRVGETLHEVLTMRRVTYGVRDLDLDDPEAPIKRRSMGGRFALRFGNERSDDGGEMRRSHVRTAFNSPFWPFVLATTSVGQEGLDFHLYCHAVVHWNLPANPVDLEQREGRVHRYKGHAVRRNLARALGVDALYSNDPWEWMFDEGARRRDRKENDIVPLWVYAEGDARIERIVPALPLSRDRSRLESLKRSLVAYRLAFGQPRQEELVAFVTEMYTEEEVNALRDELHIDLSPTRAPTRPAHQTKS